MKFFSITRTRLYLTLFIGMLWMIIKVSQAADLVPVSLSMSGTNIALSVQNTSYGVSVNGFYVSISANGKSQALYIGYMGPRQITTVTTPAIYFGTGSASVTGVVDAYGWIPEGYPPGEDNNVMTATLDLGGSTSQGSSVDLIIDDIRESDPYFFVKIRNQGGGTTYKSSYLRVCLNGYCLNNYVATPGAGASNEFSYNKSQFYVTSGGSYSVSATIDSTNLITEYLETNNSLSETLYFSTPQELPDLIVEDILFQNGGIDVKIKNIGTGSANAPIKVQLSRPGTSYAMVRSYTNSSYPLYTGTTRIVSFLVSDVGASGLSSVNLKASVDWDNSVNESNELNNDLSKTVTLEQLLPDLIVEDVFFEGTDVKVKIKNQGAAASSSAHYTRIYMNGYYNYIYSSTSIPIGSSVTLSYPAAYFYLIQGQTYTATVNADSDGYVLESNESNNTLSKSLVFGSTSTSSGVDLVVVSVERYVYLSYLYAKINWKNQGTAYSAPVDIKLSYGTTALTSSVTYSNYSAPAPGATSTTYVYIGYTSTYPLGSLQVQATVDSTNKQIESNENNNSSPILIF
ncbi:MAG: hypothetical protein HYV97_17470 [Bdellovibrio sp.]|nr:hypothetical protein [Bdellovibrio sp.]